ncbi:MAG TPA: hypothetical protein DCL35_03235, partial [Candidatus Omnitrophica bacterium]|nr:hypothetical protein [Candidatus Omnitrophota bacterium]
GQPLKKGLLFAREVFFNVCTLDENQKRGLLRRKDRFLLNNVILHAKKRLKTSRRRAPEGEPLGSPMGKSEATTGSIPPLYQWRVESKRGSFFLVDSTTI